MNILITGGTGLIGGALVKSLSQDGYGITILTRNPVKAAKKGDSKATYISDISESNNVDIIINLAGETISERWTDVKKKELVKSRVSITQQVVNYIANAKDKPKLLISGSAKWNQKIKYERKRIEDIVAEDNVSKSYVSMIVKLMLLSPTIIEDILNGSQPKNIQLKDLMKPFPYC